PSANLPNSPEVIEALSNPDLYDQLSARFAQSPLQSNDIFKKESSGDRYGTRSVCPAYEGKNETINGREYNLYCINAPWGAFFWLSKAKSLEECEANCHKNSYDCNPPASATTATPKSAPSPSPTNPPPPPPGTLCPLPASDNKVWHYAPYNQYPFKMSCLNAFNVPATEMKNKGYVGE
ncbi:MAG: hypothetical protein L6R42_010345, partial [Xanthoria sp. 1 TBL-2021]